MPYTPTRTLDATTDSLERYLETATSLGVDPSTFAEVRTALEHAAALDPDDRPLKTNLEGARDRVGRALADGTMDVDQAREELREVTTRAAADDEFAHVLTRAWNTRARQARAVGNAIDWTSVLLPIGLEAAAKVESLAGGIPAGTTDSSALRGADAGRRRWLEFGSTIGRWTTVVDLLAALRRDGMVSSDPIPARYREDIHPADWRWTNRLILGHARASGTGTDGGSEGVLAAVQAGAGPTVATPAEVHARLERRRNLREANEGLVAMGFAIPGADVAGGPEVLPASVRDQYRAIA